MKNIVGITLLLATATAVFAEDKPAPSPEKEKKICRKEDVPNSRMQRRTCLTQAQWDAKAAARNAGDFGTTPLRNYSQIGQRANY